MKNSTVMVAVIVAICAMSCTKQDVNTTLPQVQQLNKGISREIEDLGKGDVMIVASRYVEEKHTKVGGIRTVEDVKEIRDDDGNVTMYAVNFAGDNGYLIISATKKYYPILADVERGNYREEEKLTGASILMEEYQNSIKYCKSLPKDSLARFRTLWSKYEEIPSVERIENPRTKSGENELMELVAGSVSQWISEGYDVYPLSEGAFHTGLPASVYNQWYNIARTESHPNYDFEENCFILRKSTLTVSQNGPYIFSKWNQLGAYNNSIPFYQGNSLPVGCAVIAAGQIMRYHEWPVSFQWNMMPDILDNSIDGQTTLSNFLYSLGLAMGCNYSQGETNVNISGVQHTLESYNYSGEVRSHNSNTVADNIILGLPVYMRGSNNQNEIGHAWVCDGLKKELFGQIFELKIISTYNYPLQFISPCNNYYEPESTLQYFRMVFGNGGTDDGWYLDNSIPWQYANVRQDVVGICPSN